MATTKKPGTEAELDASKLAAREALEKLLEAKDHFRSAAEAAGLDLKEEAIDQMIRGRDKAEELTATATEFAREKPMQALAVAFVGGYILSQFFRK